MLFNGISIITGKVFTRPFLILFLKGLIHLSLTAQTIELPISNDGKVEYFKTVEPDSINYFALWENATTFLRSLSVPDQLTKDVQCNAQLTKLEHQFGFYLYVKPTLTKQIDGVMMADITINVEEKKYQYTIHNFQFIKYARNRFGQFVPKSSKKYPLELYYPNSNKKTWKAHFEEINSKILKFQHNLELKMSE